VAIFSSKNQRSRSELGLRSAVGEVDGRISCRHLADVFNRDIKAIQSLGEERSATVRESDAPSHGSR